MKQILVDINGYKQAVHVSGSGPLVIGLPGGTDGRESWQDVIPFINTMCTFAIPERPGLGNSDPLPTSKASIPRSARWIARQLRTVLDEAGLKPPYILLAHSISSFTADQFAVLWPNDVAGLILLDSTNITPIPGDDVINYDEADGKGLIWAKETSRAELAESQPPTYIKTILISTAIGSWLDFDVSTVTTVLTNRQADDFWQKCQREWASRWSAQHIIADTADHYIQNDQPQLVVEAIRQLIESVSSGKPLQLDPSTISAVGGKLHITASDN